MDECSYGSWIGNVWSGCVILAPSDIPAGLSDSKKLSPAKRQELYNEIVKRALSWGVGFATAAEIDATDVLRASWLAMRRAYAAMPVKPTSILVDGNRVPEGFDIPVMPIVKGDETVKAISAASILAKVSRTMEMEALDILHPAYGFAKHQGYGTAAHLAALKKHGVLPLHRKSFRPIAALL